MIINITYVRLIYALIYLKSHSSDCDHIHMLYPKIDHEYWSYLFHYNHCYSDNYNTADNSHRIYHNYHHISCITSTIIAIVKCIRSINSSQWVVLYMYHITCSMTRCSTTTGNHQHFAQISRATTTYIILSKKSSGYQKASKYSLLDLLRELCMLCKHIKNDRNFIN